MDNLEPKTSTMAALTAGSGAGDSIEPKGRYFAQCRDADGNLKWEDHYDNLVTDVGVKAMQDTYLAGSGYTAAFYMGLIAAGTAPVVTDTAASHAGWTEAGGANAPAYSAPANRATCAWSAASGTGAGSRTKALSAGLDFTFSAPGTIKGSFLSTAATKDAATGTLFSAGFFTGGDRTVAANDKLTITYQLSM